MGSHLRRDADKGIAPAQAQDEAPAANPPHFFKVILSLEPKLMLPKKFVRDYGHNLPGTVLLEAPKGPIWQTRLTRSSDDEVWLDEGFQQFKEYYSIGFGYFLVFRYDDEDSSFRVLIFDNSAVEIEYSSCSADKLNRSSSCLEKAALQVKLEDDVSLETLGDLPHMCKAAGEISRVSPSSKIKAEGSSLNVDSSDQKSEKRRFTGTGYHLGPKKEAVLVKQKVSAAYQKEKGFKSRKPFFVAYVHPSYVSGRLGICRNFARKYLTNRMHCDVELRVSDGKKWKVKCSVGSCNANLTWNKFVQDNGVQVGDVCVLERENDNTACPVLNVIIFSATEDAKDDCKEESNEVRPDNFAKKPTKRKSSQADVIPTHNSKRKIRKEGGTSSGRRLQPPEPVSTIIEKEKFLSYQKARAFKSVNPYFVAFMQPSYVSHNYYLSFSTYFAKKYLYKPKDAKVKLLAPDGTKWMVRCCIGVSNAKLRWREFVLHNGLQVGDACVFEWEPQTTPSLNVTIYRN